MKHEWRKHEKSLYVPKTEPIVVDIPTFNFISIKGQGNPNSAEFPEYIEALYAVAYAIKMNLKKGDQPEGYIDYTVYPLEGVWDITEEAKKTFDGTLNKDDLVFTLMIRQPEFVNEEIALKMIELCKVKKKPIKRLGDVFFDRYAEGKSIQMMHLGSFDNEHESFERMEAFCKEEGLRRSSKVHREIYLSDTRKVTPDKYKTILRFKVD